MLARAIKTASLVVVARRACEELFDVGKIFALADAVCVTLVLASIYWGELILYRNKIKKIRRN